MAMGGAFLAVLDETASMAWNPAGFTVPLCRRGSRARVHANALGAAAILQETGILTGVETDEFERLPGLEKISIALGSVCKAVTFRTGSLCAGALLLEEGLDPSVLAESQGLADAGDLLDSYYTTFALSFNLAPTVSVGAAHTVFAGLDASGDRVYGGARAYGALLRPSEHLAVGLTYFDVAPGFEDVRRDLEGFSPRTMNAGVAYVPFPSLLLTFDLRDLSERWDSTALEPHGGLEWWAGRHVALRAGAYAEEDGGDGVLTLGAGVISMERCRGAGAEHGDACVVNYATLLSTGEAPKHLLSALLHF